MYERTQALIDELYTRFGYTGDNNRDLVSAPEFSMAEVSEELAVEHHYQFLIAHLHRCNEQTDKACWGD